MKNWKILLYLNTKMIKLKPIIFQSILASFKEIAHQGYSSSYHYFHFLGYWMQATWHIELIAKVILFHISYPSLVHAASDNPIASMIKIASKFSDDIRMSFGVDKCKKSSPFNVEKLFKWKTSNFW